MNTKYDFDDKYLELFVNEEVENQISEQDNNNFIIKNNNIYCKIYMIFPSFTIICYIIKKINS